MPKPRPSRKQPNEERRLKWRVELNNLGLVLPEDATEEQLWDALILHRDVARFVGDVWYKLTGTSHKSGATFSQTFEGGFVALSTRQELPRFNEFVSSLFADYCLASRLATKERERTEYATRNLTQEQQDDDYEYIHVVKGKPPLIEDEDYQHVTRELHRWYGQFMTRCR